VFCIFIKDFVKNYFFQRKSSILKNTHELVIAHTSFFIYFDSISLFCIDFF